MNTDTLKKLNLAEDADEATVLAEVTKLEERVTVAETALAEAEKAKRDASVEATLSALIEGGHVAPGKKAELIALAEASPAGFDIACALLADAKAVDLEEHGTREGGSADGIDASEDVAKRALALSEEKHIDLSEAMVLAISGDVVLMNRRLRHSIDPGDQLAILEHAVDQAFGIGPGRVVEQLVVLEIAVQLEGEVAHQQ